MLIVGSATHPGKERKLNEDALCVLTTGDAPHGTDALLAVADGMGGHAAGDVASKLAVQRFADDLCSAFASTVLPEDRFAPAVAKAVAKANEFVRHAAGSQGRYGMGTTLTAVLIVGPRAIIVHVGDSRAYLLRARDLHQLTQDHSWVAEQVAAGVLTPAQAAHHPQRNVITRALGASCEVRTDMAVVDLRVGDRLLLSSDGVHGVVAESEILAIVGKEEPQAACDRLVERANELGGPDNSTALVALLAA